MQRKIRLNHLKNKHKSEKGIIIGGGPSLKEEIQNNYFNRLKSTNKYVIIGTNVSAFEIIEPDYHIFIDRWLWQKFYKQIDSLKNCIKLSQIEREYPKTLRRPLSNNVIRIPTEGVFYPLMDDRNIKCNNTGSGALSLADYLGLNEIYLFGFDMRLNKENKKNFHDYYKEKNKADIQVVNNTIDNHYNNITAIIKKLKRKNIKVFSCSSESKLNDQIVFVDPIKLL